MALTSADVNDVFEFLASIRGKWLLLGTSLKLNAGKLEDIETKCGTDTITCLLKVLQLWLKANRSWAELAKALDSAMVGEEELAEKGMTAYTSSSVMNQATIVCILGELGHYISVSSRHPYYSGLIRWIAWPSKLGGHG
jgi:hypothetical protein